MLFLGMKTNTHANNTDRCKIGSIQWYVQDLIAALVCLYEILDFQGHPGGARIIFRMYLSSHSVWNQSVNLSSSNPSSSGRVQGIDIWI